jgi:hypothetical protein
LIDLFRKKSPAPLLTASVLGFAGATFISLYHFFMMDVVINFDQSHIKMAAFWLMGLTAMPMLLAFVRHKDLTWRPAKWLLVCILGLCAIQYYLPGFSAERPREMSLMYSELEGDDHGFLVLESIYQRHDQRYAKGHGFELKEINSGQLGRVTRPVREVSPLHLPGIEISAPVSRKEADGWHREFTIDLPPDSRLVKLAFPRHAGLSKAWVNGELALDTELESKRQPAVDTLQLVYPGSGPIELELLSASGESFTLAAVTWHDLPPVLAAPFMGNWPDDARPFLYGSRAEKIQEFTIGPAEPAN